MEEYKTVLIEKRNYRRFGDYLPEKDSAAARRENIISVGLMLGSEPAGAISCMGNELLSFYVEEDKRRSGYGRLMLERLEEELRKKGYDSISAHLALPDDCEAVPALVYLGFMYEDEGYSLVKVSGRDVRTFIESENTKGKKSVLSFIGRFAKGEILSLESVSASGIRSIEEGIAADFVTSDEECWGNIARPLSFVSFVDDKPVALVLVEAEDGKHFSVRWFDTEEGAGAEGLAIIFRMIERLSMFMEDDDELSFAAMTDSVIGLCDRIFDKTQGLTPQIEQTVLMIKEL